MKHWKRILSALLIGAMALTLFARCDKKVKLEDELFNQIFDFYQTLGRTVERSPDNSDAEKILTYVQKNYATSGSTSLNNYMGKLKSASKTVLPAVYDVSSTDYVRYTIAWCDVIPNPKSEYFKSATGMAANIMHDAFLSVSPQKVMLENTTSGVVWEKTEHFSVTQGEIDGYPYYIIVLRRSGSVTT